jgi:hypothetical protein
MRNRLAGLALAVMVALVCTGGMLGQAAAAQRAANAPAPDIAGVWRRSRTPPDKARQYTLGEIVGSIGDIPPMTPWAMAKFKANEPNGGPHPVPLGQTNDPQFQCFPPGVPRIYSTRLGAPFEIIQIPGKVVMIFEYDHFVREIFTDGRQHPQDLNPTWMGDSVGKWEGNTLVADAVGFNDKTWLDGAGHPHSELLHLVERIRRPTRDAMIDDITIEDPKAYTKPWVAHEIFELKPGWDLEEYVCEDNLNFKDLQSITESPK